MEILSAIIQLLGGLAMFLYGIEVMGDGLKNAAGMALPLAWMYRRFARDFRVLVLSRAVPLKDGSTTAAVAKWTQ